MIERYTQRPTVLEKSGGGADANRSVSAGAISRRKEEGFTCKRILIEGGWEKGEGGNVKRS